MGIIKGSITIIMNSSGNYQAQMPENNLDVIGIAPLGYNGSPIYNAPPIVGIYLDASNIAYFPMPFTQGSSQRKYSPIHIKLKGNILNLYVPFSNQAFGGLTIFYGIPDGNEIEIEDLKGVAFMYQNTSTTSSASGTLSINFPSGNVKLRGIYVMGISASGQISFNSGAGNMITIPFSINPDPMDLPDNIYPLNLSSATTLNINYNINYNSNGNASLFGIIYYE